MNEKSTALAKNDSGLKIVDLTEITGNSLPDLSQADEYPFDLMADYWTPENKGESKRVFFDKIADRKVLDQQSQEIIDLECVYFFEQINGEIKSVSNGSKRLVGAIEANSIERGTPLLITYMGKKKNKNNSFLSDNWSVKILRLKVA